jgi:anti-sigma factor RsiW
MTDQLKITDLDVTAYIDGELDAARMRAVEGAASRDAGLAARIAAYRTDKAMLKNIYTPLADRPIPPAWIDLARATPYTPARARRSWRSVGVAAALVLALIGGLSVYDAAYRPGPAGEAVQAALSARKDEASPEKFVAVANITEARRYDAALEGIVGVNVKVPALDSMGYRVTGLKFYARAAEIQYRDDKGRLFTLYLRPSDGTIRFDQFERDGLHVCIWQDDRISTVMAGAISAAMMQRLASLTYLGLTA